MDKTIINPTTADICKFVTDGCCHIGGKFFYAESELAMEEKYVKLRNWRIDLDMNNNKLPNILCFFVNYVNIWM